MSQFREDFSGLGFLMASVKLEACRLWALITPIPRTKLVGFCFIGVGIALYGTWALWLITRTERPVNIPIPMTVGHIRTREFKLNMNAPYTIMVEVQKAIPFDTLNCLLGTSMAPTSTDLQDCSNVPSVVKASRELTSDGQVVAEGFSDDYRSGAWMNDSISRELGHFQSQRGRRYVLDVDVLADGSSLAPGNPRLKVEVHPDIYEGNIFWSFVLFLATAVLVLVGSILLIVSFIKNRPRRSIPAKS